MKKILSILGIISLITSWSSNLIACNKTNNSENDRGNKSKPIPKPEKPKLEQPPENSNWKLVVGDFWEEVKQSSDDKWYIAIYWRYGKTDDDIYWTIDKFNNIKKIKMNYYDKVYRWDGDGEPKLPIINPNTGKITDWK